MVPIAIVLGDRSWAISILVPIIKSEISIAAFSLAWVWLDSGYHEIEGSRYDLYCSVTSSKH